MYTETIVIVFGIIATTSSEAFLYAGFQHLDCRG